MKAEKVVVAGEAELKVEEELDDKEEAVRPSEREPGEVEKPGGDCNVAMG